MCRLAGMSAQIADADAATALLDLRKHFCSIETIYRMLRQPKKSVYGVNYSQHAPISCIGLSSGFVCYSLLMKIQVNTAL
jgi:hypothetical protein